MSDRCLPGALLAPARALRPLSLMEARLPGRCSHHSPRQPPVRADAQITDGQRERALLSAQGAGMHRMLTSLTEFVRLMSNDKEEGNHTNRGSLRVNIKFSR